MDQKIILLAAAGILLAGCSGSQQRPSPSAAAEIESGFICPPNEAKPRVWWHWMNGNITKDGALKDIEWMNRIGIGGFQTFDAALSTPQIVDHRITYMTDEWKDIFKTVTEKAHSYGMEMAIAGSPGWSESGGPWVPKNEAMKKVVWSEVDLEGGKEVKITLPDPPSVAGSFLNIGMSGGGGFTGVQVKSDNVFYQDIAVIAMKLPEDYKPLARINPTITTSGAKVSLESLIDEDYVRSQMVTFDGNGKAWIQYEFSEPVTIYGASIVGSTGSGGRAGRRQAGPSPVLEYSHDGKDFTKIADVPSAAAGVSSMAFAGVTAKYFRLSYQKPENTASGVPIWISEDMVKAMGLRGDTPAVRGADIAEFHLFNVPRINRFIEKAAYANAASLDGSAIANTKATAASDIIDISDKMDANGELRWTPGEGNWKVIRFGYSLTGHQNSPASAEATGLEVDKLNADYVKKYFNTYLDMYKDATGGLMGAEGLTYVITDSWEAGAQNWTDKMAEEFKKDAGYEMTSFLPTLAGYAVESTDSSDKFLWDFRKTIADLNAKNHYDALTELLAERGMARYTESHENSRAFTADGMQVKKNSAVPMSAMWTDGLGQSGADIRESSSTAHIYGQRFIAAESLTTGSNAWGWSPASLKKTADKLLAHGLNRFVIHESAHQPLDDYKPGLTLGPFGQWFNRHETWSEQAVAWISYMAKSSYLLSRGTIANDILYYYGENTNITGLYNDALPEIPEGYDFDFVNPDALMNDLSVKSGNIMVPSGSSYKVLYLGGASSEMSVPVLKALDKLVCEGATIIGARPTVDPSLADDPAEWNSLCDKLWDGKIISTDLASGIKQLGIAPDVTYTKPNQDSEYLFKHRTYKGIHIYWLNSRTARVEDIEATFRVNGLEPEIWNAVTGSIEKASYTISGATTTVKMHFEPEDALFVVFRSKAKADSYSAPEKIASRSSVDGPWTVAFNGMGCPEAITLEALQDLKDNENPYIRYYAGDIVYKKDITLTSDQIEGKTFLDLGDVAVLAEIKVNGQDCGITWKKPYRVDISSAAKEGENQIEIKVVNLWVNRLIGDQRKDAGQFTFTTQTFRRATEDLVPSGLLGPVEVITEKEI